MNQWFDKVSGGLTVGDQSSRFFHCSGLSGVNWPANGSNRLLCGVTATSSCFKYVQHVCCLAALLYSGLMFCHKNEAEFQDVFSVCAAVIRKMVAGGISV